MMKRRKLSLAAGIVVAIIVFSVNYLIPAPTITTIATVTRVIDGDTIVVEGGERVRLLDIDTPERGQPCSTNATKRLGELIDGKEITLISGKENRDVYDRLLRYVFLNDTFVNLVLVREGWANLYIVNKDQRYYDSLLEAEQAAKRENLCVWSS
jgi:micrococcal nuclease